MNNDLISREALKKAFEDTVCIEPMPYAFVKQIIDNAPTVEERPQGKWGQINVVTMPYLVAYSCPFCKEWGNIQTFKPNFCPNCGADMRGDNNE